MAMMITVILCTYNRCGRLTKTLESIAVSKLPNSVEWEVLVVDNNSNDQTRAVVEEFARRYPGQFRYVFEPKQGKSHALNNGIRQSHSPILAFMDDDVIVEPSWLQNLTADLHDDEWAGAGGRILPERTFSPPRWMSLKDPGGLGGALCGMFDRGDTPGRLEIPPHGANMAFRREMFERYGGFRIDLCPLPGNAIHGEDTEFGLRLLKAGERLRYEPLAIVRHPVLENRLNKRYFLAWWFAHGQGAIRQRRKRAPIWGIPQRYFSIANRIVHLLPVRTLRWMRALNPQWRFWCKCYVWMTAGEIAEFCRRRTGATNHMGRSDRELSCSGGENNI
jgi:glycosyltransferase involved in cell wall biosynthesis